MGEFEKQNGVSFLIIYFSARQVFYYLTYAKMKEFVDRADSGGRKSFTYDELDPAFQIPSGNGVFVNYLEVLQKDLDLRD